MRTIVPALFLGISSVAHAQQRSLDTALATELIRGATTPIAANALQSNPDFARLYNAGAVEQELAQEAARRGLTERLDVQRALTIARYQILIQALQADVIRDVKGPTDAEIKAYYDKNKSDITIREGIRAEVFLLDGSSPTTLDVARAAVAAQKIDPAELQKTRFQQVATAEGAWIPRENLPEDVWGEVKTLPKGRVRFFKAGDNYLLFRFEEYRESRPATLDEAKEDIRRLLLSEKQQKAWNDHIETTRKRLGVTP